MRILDPGRKQSMERSVHRAADVILHATIVPQQRRRQHRQRGRFQRNSLPPHRPSRRPRDACRIGESGGTVIRMRVSRIPSITWHEPGGRVAADPGATLALDRTAWERLGARFAPVDDGQGENPGLATASLSTKEGPVTVGVLDYGESITYLLVPGARDERPTTTAQVLQALSESGAIALDEDLVDVVRTLDPPDSLEQRVAELERQLKGLHGDAPAAESPDRLVHVGVKPGNIVMFEGNVVIGGEKLTGRRDVSHTHARVTTEKHRVLILDIGDAGDDVLGPTGPAVGDDLVIEITERLGRR